MIVHCHRYLLATLLTLLIVTAQSGIAISEVTADGYKLTAQCLELVGEESPVAVEKVADRSGLPSIVMRHGQLPKMTNVYLNNSTLGILFEARGKQIIHCSEQHISTNFIFAEDGTANSLFMLDEFEVTRLHIHSHVSCGTSCYHARVDTIAFPEGDWEVLSWLEMQSPTYEYPSKWFRKYLNNTEQQKFDKIMEEG
jgi:hypothetical protein